MHGLARVRGQALLALCTGVVFNGNAAILRDKRYSKREICHEWSARVSLIWQTGDVGGNTDTLRNFIVIASGSQAHLK